MEKVYKAETINTPKIVLDHLKGYIEIKGKSIPENTGRFYAPIVEWVKKYAEHPQKKTTVIFFIEYMNSTTLKFYYMIMKVMESLQKQGLEIDMTWFFEKDDEDIQETGEYLESVIDTKVKLIEVEVDDNN